MKNLLNTVALAGLMSAVGFGYYQYELVHLPDYDQTKSEMLYWKCVRECENTCVANGIPADRCDCSHCQRYLD